MPNLVGEGGWADTHPLCKVGTVAGRKWRWGLSRADSIFGPDVCMVHLHVNDGPHKSKLPALPGEWTRDAALCDGPWLGRFGKWTCAHAARLGKVGENALPPRLLPAPKLSPRIPVTSFSLVLGSHGLRSSTGHPI